MSDQNFSGEVIWFDAKRGYGFIAWDKNNVRQKDLFAHFSDISCNGFKTPYKGQKVTFGIGTNKHGDPKAIDIKIV